ncbi:DUF4844 domain-containing protein [Chitinophaga rhizophila]|uniref:DUF4844 domain-containing protein n=1 Tax=Chitinophaga rhizophila TaxID=2866212 RepID=A0ABS7GJR2_9BACT|nr:DUF4844 domain-containing protein [Chitinophaga rhizophila]MBW8687972.1 DUF4844 domain-containing protein [Chitinophaga rhizophila]
MREKEHIITALAGFRRKNKFSYSVFQERGLHPSDDELCSGLQALLNDCSDQLIVAVNSGVDEKKLAKILKSNLSNIDAANYDTEERELICDYFYELSQIVVVDIKSDLNNWLYGVILGTLLKITSILKRSDKALYTLEQSCTGCKIPLKTAILSRNKGIPDHSWHVIRCNNCDEYNLLSVGEGVSEYRFENYQSIEALPKSAYTKDEACVRLEQIRYFRKR